MKNQKLNPCTPRLRRAGIKPAFTKATAGENQRVVLRRGFTIAELLMALMITGMLLAAVAVAFNASVKNFSDNKEIFFAANEVRQALTQIVPRLRTADVNSVSSSAPSNECVFNEGGQSITYRYVSGEQKLYMITGSDTRLLCDNVTAMTFTKYPDAGDPTKVKSVIISMTVAEGTASQTFSTAVVIRKNL